MPGRPEAVLIERFLRHVRGRLVALRILEGGALGVLLVALVIAIAGRPGTAAAAATLGALVAGPVLVRAALGDAWRFGWWRDRWRFARYVEQRAPWCRNLLVTAVELVDQGKTSGYAGSLVLRRAEGLVEGIDPARLFPARPGIGALAGAILLLVAALATSTTTGATLPLAGARPGVPAVRRIEVRVIPPAYTRVPPQELVNPSRIEALAASRLEVRVEAGAAGVTIETLDGSREMSAGPGAWSAPLDAKSDGFIAIEPRDADGARGARSIIGLVVTPDRAPRVSLATPGRDLVFASIPDTLPVVIEAEDDIGLAALRLQYTAVSGSGERFTFTERDVPVRVQQSSPRSWRATGTWDLRSLGLQPGDVVVYRAIATDGRPGAGGVSSESYVIEVATPGAIAAEGFAADDERDRYAASQQMVILRTERLIAARAGLAADSLRDASRLLAAEQRQVRAEFVFMMGGELEDAALETSGTLELDETAEAEAEGDLLAGRLQNQGRLDMVRAIRAMSRASSLLFEASLDGALRAERIALDNLMRAFSRSRFILRALTQRERIDLERRLTGSLGEAAGIVQPVPAPASDARVGALRRLLAEVAAWRGDATGAARVDAAGVSLLRAEPSDSNRLLVARAQDMTRGRHAAGAFDALTRDLARRLAARVPAAAPRAAPLEADALAGAWRDAWLRARGEDRR